MPASCPPRTRWSSTRISSSRSCSSSCGPTGWCPSGSRPSARPRVRSAIGRPMTRVDVEDPVIVAIARRLGVHPAVVCVKWAIQRGQVPDPVLDDTAPTTTRTCALRQVSPSSDADMSAIAGIDRNCRLIKGQVFLWKAGAALGGPLGPRRHHHATIGAPPGPAGSGRERPCTSSPLTRGPRARRPRSGMPAAPRSPRLRPHITWTGPTPSAPRSTPNGGGTLCAGRLPRCSRRVACAPQDVAAVAVDGIGWTLVPVDDAFRPLTPAMTWLDRRAEGEAAALRAGPDAARLIDLVANPLDAAYITPKLAWLRAHEPAIFDGDPLVPHRIRLPDRAAHGRGDLRPDPGVRLPLLRHPPRAMG